MPLGVETLTRAVFKRARRGLYAGRKLLTGNNISEDGGNRTRRVWKPNAHSKRLFSEVLNKMIRLRVTTAALRNIDKAGGLDNYILQTPAHKLDSDLGDQLKQKMQAELQRQRRKALLPTAAAAAVSGEAGA